MRREKERSTSRSRADMRLGAIVTAPFGDET
jgi:hypothetical protein